MKKLQPQIIIADGGYRTTAMAEFSLDDELSHYLRINVQWQRKDF